MSMYERSGGNPRDILFDRTIPNGGRTMDDFFDEAQAGSVQIFEDIKARAPAHPTFGRVDSDLFRLRTDVLIGIDKITAVIALEGGSTPEETKVVRISPVGSKSYLEVTDRGGEIKETVDHKIVPHPATIHDIAYYRLIVDSLE